MWRGSFGKRRPGLAFLDYKGPTGIGNRIHSSQEKGGRVPDCVYINIAATIEYSYIFMCDKKTFSIH
jgi:hypothetical protein